MRSHATGVFLLLLTALPAFGQEQASLPLGSEAPAAAQAALDSTVVALTAQLEAMRSYQRDLLHTLHWSLGTIGVIFVAIVGLGWWANFRIYKSDLASIRSELAGKIEDEIVSERERLDEVVASASSRVEDAVEGQQDELEGIVQTEVSRLERKLGKRIAYLEKQAVQQEVDLAKLGEKELSLTAALVNKLSWALNHGHSVTMTSTLTELTECLEEGTQIMDHRVTDVSELLDQIPDKHAVEKERLRDALQEANTL